MPGLGFGPTRTTEYLSQHIIGYRHHRHLLSCLYVSITITKPAPFPTHTYAPLNMEQGR